MTDIDGLSASLFLLHSVAVDPASKQTKHHKISFTPKQNKKLRYNALETWNIRTNAQTSKKHYNMYTNKKTEQLITWTILFVGFLYLSEHDGVQPVMECDCERLQRHL